MESWKTKYWTHEKRINSSKQRFIDLLKEHASDDSVLLEEINTIILMDDGCNSSLDQNCCEESHP
ncbi:MAG: hypothetical protein ACI8RD_014379 [Bacillariaceae sp.]|jgi:hypothetical protein